MATTERYQCPLCYWKAEVLYPGGTYQVTCERCGEFKISTTLFAVLEGEAQKTKSLLPYLSAHTRQANERGEIVTLTAANWTEYALLHQNTAVTRKLTMLLELTAARSKPAGTPVRFSDTDSPLVDAETTDELAYLLEQLGGMGYLQLIKDWVYQLKAKGWEQLEANSFAGKPGKCFVAMSFDPSLDNAWGMVFISP